MGPARLRLKEAGEADIDSSALSYPAVPPPVGSGSIGVRPAEPAHHRGGGRHREPRWVPAGWGRGAAAPPLGRPRARRSFSPASASAPNSSAAVRRGPVPEGPLPASRPSQGSAPPPRPRGGEGRPRSPLVPAPRGRGGGGERPPPRRRSARRLRPAAGPQSAPQAPSPPGARRSPPYSPWLPRGSLRPPLGKVTFRFESERRWCQQVSSPACLLLPAVCLLVWRERRESVLKAAPRPFFCVTGP